VTQVQDAGASTLRTLTYRPGGDLIIDAGASPAPTFTYSYNARKQLVLSNIGGVDAGGYS
jgi:hypothetical protein